MFFKDELLENYIVFFLIINMLKTQPNLFLNVLICKHVNLIFVSCTDFNF